MTMYLTTDKHCHRHLLYKFQDQKRQIKRMQDDIIGLLGERAIQDMEDRIEDKKEFIAELEEEVAELEQRLNDDLKEKN